MFNQRNPNANCSLYVGLRGRRHFRRFPGEERGTSLFVRARTWSARHAFREGEGGPARRAFLPRRLTAFRAAKRRWRRCEPRRHFDDGRLGKREEEAQPGGGGRNALCL